MRTLVTKDTSFRTCELWTGVSTGTRLKFPHAWSRLMVHQPLISFDRTWSTLMNGQPWSRSTDYQFLFVLDCIMINHPWLINHERVWWWLVTLKKNDSHQHCWYHNNIDIKHEQDCMISMLAGQLGMRCCNTPISCNKVSLWHPCYNILG